MSIYDNDTKIYPDLNPSAPQEPQTYRLKKLTEIEAFFLDEIEARKREAKKKKRLNTIIGIVDTGLITSAVIAGGASIPAFASGAGLPVGAALCGAWGSSFPFNGRHTKIFQEPNGEARKTRCHYAACPKQVRQHSRYHFTGNARRRHLPH